MRRALLGLALLIGCGAAPAPQKEPAPRPTAGSTEHLDAPFEGTYTDSLRVVTVTYDPKRGYQGVLEDDTEPGWSQPYTAPLAAEGTKLTGVFDDHWGTQVTLEVEGDALRLETRRSGHENPRHHELARVDADAWAGAQKAYEQAYPHKTVDTPRRKGELLAAHGEELRAEDPTAAAALFDAAGTLLWPKTRLVAGVVHRAGECWLPSKSPDGDWDKAAKRFARAAELRGEVGDAAAQAASLLNQAHCHNPSFNPEGDPAEAERLYAQAADAAEQGKRPDLLRRARRERAVCLAKRAVAEIGGDRKRMTPAARRLFEQAQRLAQQAGDAALGKTIAGWIR